MYQLGPDVPPAGLRPIVRTGVGQAYVGSTLVLGSEHGNQLVALDQVSAIIWESFAGTAKVWDIAADVADVFGGDRAQRISEISSMIRTLADAGFMDHPEPQNPVPPRHHHPQTPRASRMGMRFGVPRLEVRQVRAAEGGGSFRVAAAVSDTVDELVAKLTAEEVDGTRLETLILQDTGSSGATSLQVLSDGLGRTRYTSRDPAAGVEALRRTAAAYSRAASGTWLEAAAFSHEDRAVLVHPAFRERLVHLDQPVLHEVGIELVPCGLVQLGPDGRLSAPADPVTGARPLSWNFAGIVAPRAGDGVQRFQGLLEVAWRWDQAHFDLVAGIDRDGLIHETDPAPKTRDLIDTIAAACGAKPSRPQPALHVPVPQAPRTVPVEIVDPAPLDLPHLIRIPRLLAPHPDRIRQVRSFVQDQWLDFPDDGPVYNFEIVGDVGGFFADLFDRFVEVSRELVGPFDRADGDRRCCWAYCSNDVSRSAPFHTHTRTAHINGVYYLSVPHQNEGDGALALTDLTGAQVDIATDDDDLLIFDVDVPHLPRPIPSPQLRIAINMEILVTEPEAVAERLRNVRRDSLPRSLVLG